MSSDWLCDLVNAAQDCVVAECDSRYDDDEIMLRKLERSTDMWLANSPNHRLVFFLSQGRNLNDVHLCGFVGCLHCVRNMATFFGGASFRDVRDALLSALEKQPPMST